MAPERKPESPKATQTMASSRAEPQQLAQAPADSPEQFGFGGKGHGMSAEEQARCSLPSAFSPVRFEQPGECQEVRKTPQHTPKRVTPHLPRTFFHPPARQRSGPVLLQGVTPSSSSPSPFPKPTAPLSDKPGESKEKESPSLKPAGCQEAHRQVRQKAQPQLTST